MLVFEERGKPEHPEKTSRSKDENQRQTQPTYDAESGNRTRATLVGGECSHHCAIPAILLSSYNESPQCLVYVCLLSFNVKSDGFYTAPNVIREYFVLGEGGKLVSTVSDPKRNRDCSI